MLKSIRKKHKEILWLLVIIIVPGFTLWGISSVISSRRGQSPSYAGTIFGHRVSFDTFRESWLAVRNQAILSYGYDQLRQISKYLNFEREAWQRLILLHEARKKGITVSDKEVIDYIAGLPIFQTEGKFDPELYKARLNLLFDNTPARVFEQQIRESLCMFKLYELITRDIKVSEEEVREAYKEDNEKVKINYILFPSEKYKEEVRVNQEEIKKFYEANKVNYKRPEQVNVDYICLTFDSFIPEAQKIITEKELQDYYEDNKESFRLPDKENNDEKNQQKKNTLEYQPFEEVREQILNILSQQETLRLAKEKMEKIYDDLIELDSLEKVARKYNLAIKQTGFFSRQEYIPDVGFSHEFVEEAFQRQLGEYSDLIRTAKGFYVIQPHEKKQAYIPELNEVVQEVKDDIVAKESLALAKQAAEEAKKSIIEITKTEKLDFKRAAEKLSLEVKESEFISRNDYIPELGPGRDIEQIFETEPNQIGPITLTRKGCLLFGVVEVHSIDETKFSEQKNHYRQQLLEQKKQQAYSEYLRELYLKADLRSNLEQIRKR